VNSLPYSDQNRSPRRIINSVRVSQSSDTLWQKCLPSSNGKREVNTAGTFFV